MEKFNDKLVLIADDEERNIFALASYLESMQMKVRTAKNGQEALTLLETGLRPDIILLDMMMPVMDGYETLQILKSSATLNSIPVVAVTARAMKGDYEKCMEAGAWDYVSKPIDMKLLMDVFERWIA